MPNNVQKSKKLFIKTWGCQMNSYDSNRMSDILRPLGYRVVDTPDDADMVILNTCHIREKATDKVFSDLGRLRPLKEKKEADGGKMLMAVAGCVAQAEGDFILERAPYVDMVFGPQTYHELPEMVLKANGNERIVNTDFDGDNKFDKLPEEQKNSGVSAFLSIQEGCDKFCTFCVVPYTRGSEYSRSVQEILNEAKRLVDNGALEIIVLGQNVNAFHGTGPDGSVWGLGQLLRAINEIEGIQRIRYTTSHPRDMDDDLIAAHGELDKLMPFLHLPVQSGSDKILKAMNRKHTRDLYFDVIEKLRKARPDLAFSSDFIVGFPGETEEDFEDTMNLVRRVEFSSCYSFKFSARPGTPAANMQNLVHESIASERLARLQSLLNEQQIAFNRQSVGLTLPILFDRKGKREGQLVGRSPFNQSVFVEGNERLMNSIADVKISEGYENSLTGNVVTGETESRVAP
ncbi:MAG TPA: tRNA (N6-isopentenyl adenosine(37)-C2)-methylthiotransferase MiaB [Alphaproteobacteria bacterium]|nr:tRNA (N6-isopentenyl adenosine(37)-C2)-methylthiotransferase MiaB [Alphaproteobacteria bacterium]USO06298.1 MAG: tRNA (N6-isopentenyl adenosine(37)-C2)-methylthiotransferase MiaB [Rhodospirillales bacterium]HOO81985.1 tRNA (N6-isopentenyl adenosine(37)-C2)-methylthiotransferase MiaB [Alphaproteobacteria bacterium]